MREILACIMEGLHISTTEIANELYVNPSTVRYWKSKTNTRTPGPEQFNSLCDFISRELYKTANKGTQELLVSNLMNILTDDECIALMRVSLESDDFIVNALKIRYRKENFVSEIKTLPSSGRTLAVVFDFDGTLTTKKDALSTWEKIWLALGYDQSDCEKYLKLYKQKKITHQEWCNITCEHFQARDMNEDHLNQIINKIKLMKNTNRLFKELGSHNIDIYIVSGSIEVVIKRVLKRSQVYVDRITANTMRFDRGTGKLSEIIGTKYDFIGKARFILELSAEKKISTEDILFVGNSDNDMFVWKSGAKTLCINPQFTDPCDEKVWTYSMKSCDDALKILDYVVL